MLSSSKVRKERILVIGSNGMLGQRLTEFLFNKKNIALMCASAEDESFIDDVDYHKLDVTDKEQVKNIITDFYPDIIINTAAYTNVDKSEIEKEIVWKVNVNGIENIAKFAAVSEAHVITLSTDYVFDGEAGPYSEKDLPNPINYYGRSKLAMENSLIASRASYTIIRTNVLYGPAKYGRPDFVKWVVSSVRDGKRIKIVDDQINNPTYIDDLVSGIASAAKYKKNGIFNIGGAELLDRYQFTMNIAEFFDLDKSLIDRIKTAELNQLARRPLKSGLINLKAETELNYRPHSMQNTFELMKKELNL